MGHCYFKNSWYADKFKACVILLSEALESNPELVPRVESVRDTGISRQE